VRLLRVIKTTDLESGGPIEALTRTSEILIREGHEVEVVSLETETDAKRHALPFQVTALGTGLGRYGYNRRLAPWIRENASRFDAVTVHGLWNYSSVGAWQALRRLDVPYFVYPHGMMDPWFREAYPMKHVAKQLFWWLAQGRVLRDAKAVFFTSEEEKLRARNVFSGFSYTERVVRYGTAGPQGDAESDKAAFLAAFPELAGRRFFIFISRIHPKKGCDLLIRAFAESAANADIHLVMGGPDQVGWAKDLKSLADSLGVGHRIHWTGMLKGPVKWGALRCAEAMILPSHQENFGVVVAESMACSTPVLISDKVNIWREVKLGGAGLVEPDTLEGTRSLIGNFLALTPMEKSRMRVAAREGFLRSFEIEAAARDLIAHIGFAAPAASRITDVLSGPRAR
jgi:glycosyltransferase involved in cell wall biosynthesis